MLLGAVLLIIGAAIAYNVQHGVSAADKQACSALAASINTPTHDNEARLISLGHQTDSADFRTWAHNLYGALQAPPPSLPPGHLSPLAFQQAISSQNAGIVTAVNHLVHDCKVWNINP